MSDHHHKELDVPCLMQGESLDLKRLGPVPMALGLAGALGTLVSLVLFILPATREAYSYSWLWAFYFGFSISAGGLFWVLLHHVTNAGWGVAIRRIKENLALTLPLFVLLAVPFLFPSIQESLWEWFDVHRDVAKAKGISLMNLDELGTYFKKTHTGPIYAEHHHMAILAGKMGYVNVTRWHGFVFGGLVLLCYFAWRIRSMSVKQDEVGGTRFTFKMRGASAWMLFLYALIVTFMAIDLLKGLDYTWYSTMWGVYVFAGSAGASMATLILVCMGLQRMGYLKEVVTDEHYHLMGKLLLAFTMFWGYVSFSQFMLIWYAAIPEETLWFRLRTTGSWWWISLIGLLFFRFFIPFLVLLQAWIKKKKKLFAPFCVYYLCMHALVLWVDIIPERGPSLTSSVVRGRELDPTAGTDPQMFLPWAWLGDIVAMVTVVCLLGFALTRAYSRDSLFPKRDPRLLESMDCQN